MSSYTSYCTRFTVAELQAAMRVLKDWGIILLSVSLKDDNNL